jgi:UDP-N-acetylglucosamine--N-acetylmuramyl-(pentapeptide) pyrophosphoryl-undecaprenol N-acetylglucosamine transferase
LKRILLTGGGTAGHVTPNIALIQKLREHNFEIHYVGTCHGIEHELINRENIPFHFVSAGKLRRYFDLKNITDVFRIGLGFLQSVFLIFRLHPDVVFSKGGFVSCPVVWAAWLFGKPVVIHESDITPGLANRLSIPFARKICFSFPETAGFLTTDKGVHTGIPIRHSLFEGSAEEGRKVCGFEDNKPVIMIIGGSLGSQVVNAAIRESLSTLLHEFNICHICGKGNKVEDQKGYSQFEYVNTELAHFFAMADIVVSRSGATTLFELLALRKPALLIPLASNASRGDQILNAQSFERQGFSHVLSQENLTSETLITALSAAFNDRKKMVDAMERSAVSDGVDPVISVIESVVK